MTSCMSSKRSNQLSYASEQWIVYHAFVKNARLFYIFFIFVFIRRFPDAGGKEKERASIDFPGKKLYTEVYLSSL